MIECKCGFLNPDMQPSDEVGNWEKRTRCKKCRADLVVEGLK